MTYNNPELDRIAHLSCNFGLAENYDLVYQGSNGKMNEFQAAMGILQLKYLNENIEKRKYICELYKNGLPEDIVHTKFNTMNVEYNYPYFIVKHKLRDKIHDELLRRGITTRKYFYPIANEYTLLKHLNGNYPVAKSLSEQVLAIPLYADLDKKSISKIISEIYKIIR